jgi:hypothetical protein
MDLLFDEAADGVYLLDVELYEEVILPGDAMGFGECLHFRYPVGDFGPVAGLGFDHDKDCAHHSESTPRMRGTRNGKARKREMSWNRNGASGEQRQDTVQDKCDCEP